MIAAIKDSLTATLEQNEASTQATLAAKEERLASLEQECAAAVQAAAEAQRTVVAQAEQISQLVDMQRQLNDSVLAVHAAAGKINNDEAAERVSRLEGRVDELSSRYCAHRKCR